MAFLHPCYACLNVHEEMFVAFVRRISPLKCYAVPSFASAKSGPLALSEWVGAHFERSLGNPQRAQAQTDDNDAIWLADLRAYGLILARFVSPVAASEPRTSGVAASTPLTLYI
jgi:hypothetical protein